MPNESPAARRSPRTSLERQWGRRLIVGFEPSHQDVIDHLPKVEEIGLKGDSGLAAPVRYEFSVKIVSIDAIACNVAGRRWISGAVDVVTA